MVHFLGIVNLIKSKINSIPLLVKKVICTFGLFIMVNKVWSGFLPTMSLREKPEGPNHISHTHY